MDGAPGVYSARYAGPQRLASDNIDKLLHELGDNANRNAHFKTVIALIIDGEEHTFEGIVEGTIIKERQGEGGFGYDPVFLPNGFETTFAEMPTDEKAKISHRGRATRLLQAFFQGDEK